MRPRLITLALCCLTLLPSIALDCGTKTDDSTTPEGDADADADGDGDTDADADGDTDADADADSDADTDPDFCDDALSDAPPSGPSCLSGTIACGESVTATTEGGSEHFRAVHYEAFYCLVPDGLYTGPERVYAIELEGDVLATFSLYSPCGDLDLVVLRDDEAGPCPAEDQLLTECEADVSAGSGSTSVWTDRPSRYLVIVDGKDPLEANFELSVSCEAR
jgi:hypothetical protein